MDGDPTPFKKKRVNSFFPVCDLAGRLIRAVGLLGADRAEFHGPRMVPRPRKPSGAAPRGTAV